METTFKIPVCDIDEFQKQILGQWVKKPSIQEQFINQYLHEFFDVTRLIDSSFYNGFNLQSLKSESIIHIIRKEKGGDRIYGKDLVIELTKIFGFDINSVEREVKHWLNYKGLYHNEIKEVWESSWQVTIDKIQADIAKANREHLDRIKQELFTTIKIPSNILLNINDQA